MGVSLDPKHTVSDHDFDLDAAIATTLQPDAESQEDTQSITIYRCSRDIRWSLDFLSNRHSKSIAHVSRIAFHHGRYQIMSKDFVTSITAASNKVFSLSSDPDDRSWFDHGNFTLRIAGHNRLHTYLFAQDVEAAGRLSRILGVESYAVQQIVLAAGLVFSTSLPAHTMNALVDELQRFMAWGEKRSEKAARELERVETETALRPPENPVRRDWRNVFR